MAHRLAGLTTLLFYVILSWLLPWLWSDHVDLAGGIVVLMTSALAFGVGTVGLLVFVITRPRSGAQIKDDSRRRRAVTPGEPKRAFAPIIPLGCFVLGILLLASLFYVDYYLLQRAIVLVLGLLLFGSGPALLLAPRWKSRSDRASGRADRSDITLPLGLISLGTLLLVSLPYVHYFPGQRDLMLGEGIVLSAIGAVALVARPGTRS